ncbi:glycosyl hydrolase family 28-related protein [Acerihabitans sp. KWT182]|uniref:Glycosyl hydrolase family 28-related protein n=1 Tax=Acerihabitans sp. KWT182 TaxID=3157919 RepID=A0AAU7Q6J0_9GAMM
MERRELLKGSLSGIIGACAASTFERAAYGKDITSGNDDATDNFRLSLSAERGPGETVHIADTSRSRESTQTPQGVSLSDWIFGNTRSIYLYLTQDKVDSLKRGDMTDVTTELNKAMEDNIAIFLPNGNYSISKTIKVGQNSSLIGNGAKTVYIDNQGNNHAFTFPIGYFRGTKDFFGFSIGSKKATAIDKYAFFFDSAPNGKLDYSVGWRFLCIEFYGFGMGGGLVPTGLF